MRPFDFFLFKKDIRFNSIKYSIFGLSALKIKEDDIGVSYYVFGIKIFRKKYGKISAYRNIWEIKFIKDNYNNFSRSNSIISNLCNGLDSKSRNTVELIIKRINLVLKSNRKYFDIFTKHEKEMLASLKNNFYDNIIQISADSFKYKDFYLPKNHFEASVFYYEHGLNVLDNQEKLSGKSIIDVGAFIGDSALVFQKLSPKKVYAFEANPFNAQYIEKTLDLNSLRNVEIVPLALGDKRGKVNILINDSCSKLIEEQNVENSNLLEVDMISLDEYVLDNNVEDIGLIKVDIEGAEQSFLNGAKNTICTQKPTLLLSIYHNWNDFYNIKNIISSWGLNYKMTVFKPIDGNIVLETLLICEAV